VINNFKNLVFLDEGQIAFFDQSHLNIPFQRYLSYYFYPDANYTIGI
jgi:hypothetical protein